MANPPANADEVNPVNNHPDPSSTDQVNGSGEISVATTNTGAVSALRNNPVAAPAPPPNTLNPVSRNEDDSHPSSSTGFLNIQAVIERLNTVNAQSLDSPDSNSSTDLPEAVGPVNSEPAAHSARPNNNNTVPSSTSPGPLNTGENNTPLVNGDFIYPPLPPSAPSSNTGTTGISEGVYVNGLGPAAHHTETDGTDNGYCSLTSESSSPTTLNTTDSPQRVSTNVVDSSTPTNNVNRSDNPERFYNNVDGASSPPDQGTTNSPEASSSSPTVTTENPEPSASSNIATTEHSEKLDHSASSNVITTDHSEDLLSDETTTEQDIEKADNSHLEESNTTTNTVNTEAIDTSNIGNPESDFPTDTIQNLLALDPVNVDDSEPDNSSSTTQTAQVIDTVNTGNSESESSSSTKNTAQVVDAIIPDSDAPVDPNHTAPVLGADNSEPNSFQHATQTTQNLDTVDTGNSTSDISSVPNQNTQDPDTAHSESNNSSTAQTVDVDTTHSESNNSSNPTQIIQTLDTGNSASDDSSTTNHTAGNTEIENTLNPLPDSSTLTTNNSQVIDAVNSENPESSNSANKNTNNTNNTATSFDPASVLPERSTSLGAVNSAETQLAGGVRGPPSTPPQFTSQTPRYSVRALSGDSHLEYPSTNIRPRDTSAPITATRRRRTMTTDDGSPIRVGGSGQNNGTAPGAPQSPRWHFNLLLRNASNSDSDLNGEPSTPTRPGPARFVAGSRHNSPALRRVHGSESLRNLSTVHAQNPPMVIAADEPEVNALNDIQEDEAAAEAAAVLEEEAEEDAPPVEGDLPAYNPADDDFMEEDVGGEDDDDANMAVGEDAPEGVLLVGVRRYLRQVAAEVDILDEIEAAALVRGSGAAVRARMALVFAEEGLVGALRAAVRAVEMHREEALRLADVARALRAEGLAAEDRAISNAVALEAARMELVALRHQAQRNERNGF